MASKPRRRPSIIDQVEFSAVPPDETPVKAAPSSRMATPLTKKDVQQTSIYLPRAVYDRLREIAFAERLKMHDLLMEGIDQVIASRGHPEKASRNGNS